ncbi:hypothetical protein N665_0320s0090 [Sinapis alba]|nr:hypothetical protein N665_0320s0090 [Sinapis alba]
MRRFLLGFKETPKGNSVTFQCSLSSSCVSCNSFQKRKEKHRCSETGYQIRFKCREVRGEEASHKKDAKETQQKDQSNVNDEGDEDVVDASVKQRNLHDDTSLKSKKSQSYKTYISCVPSADEERVSVTSQILKPKIS